MTPRRMIRRAVLVGYLLTVLVILLSPISPDVAVAHFTWFDKAVHLVLFGGVVALGYWDTGSVATMAIVAVVLAGAVELLQGPLPYRSAESWDFVAGAIGALVAAGVVRLIASASLR